MFSWFKKHAEAIAAWAAVIALGFNGYALIQNSKSIKAANESILLSYTPYVELDFSEQAKGIFLRNSSAITARDIRVHLISYIVQKEPFKILNRTASNGFEIANELNANDSIAIQPEQLIHAGVPDLLYSKDSLLVRVVVLTFKRYVDSKKYASISIFSAPTIGDKPSIFPFYSTLSSAAVTGPPQLFLNVIKEIQENEKLLFKSETLL